MKVQSTRLVAEVCKSAFNVIPSTVVSEFSLTKETFDRADLEISACVGTMKGSKPFNRVYCTICERESFPLLNKHQGMKTLLELIRNWDDMGASTLHVQIVGTFIDLNPMVFAGPNKQKFLEIPSDHFREAHPDKYKEQISMKDLKLQSKQQVTKENTAR